MNDFNPKAVTIGNQVWMAENLNVDDGGEGIYHNSENNETYYTWDATMRIANSIPGWHLPSTLEWNEAALACGAVKEPYKDGSNPNVDNYKKSKVFMSKLYVKMARYYDANTKSYAKFVNFWTATFHGGRKAYARFFSQHGELYSFKCDAKNNFFSIRLVKEV